MTVELLWTHGPTQASDWGSDTCLGSMRGHIFRLLASWQFPWIAPDEKHKRRPLFTQVLRFSMHVQTPIGAQLRWSRAQVGHRKWHRRMASLTVTQKCKSHLNTNAHTQHWLAILHSASHTPHHTHTHTNSTDYTTQCKSHTIPHYTHTRERERERGREREGGREGGREREREHMCTLVNSLLVKEKTTDSASCSGWWQHAWQVMCAQ